MPNTQVNEKNIRMKAVKRNSTGEAFKISSDLKIPEVPTGGARVKVHYAGACYTNRQVQKSGRRRPKLAGLQDTSLFPGYEVSGVIDALCNTVDHNKYKVGDKVIVYPEDNQDEEGFAEYIVVSDYQDLIHVPEILSMQVAAQLPTGALTAQNAMSRAEFYFFDKVNKASEDRPMNLLIIGAGALGLWTLALSQHYRKNLTDEQRKQCRVLVADSNIEKLSVAKSHGCENLVHWHEPLHEEYLIDRTMNATRGQGVDIIIDYVSSPRTISRGLKVLNQGGVMMVGGLAQYEIGFDLHQLAMKQQSVLGVSKGTREQLENIVNLVSEGKVIPPQYQVFPVEDANKVFEQLNNFQIHGRAVLQVCTFDDDDLA